MTRKNRANRPSVWPKLIASIVNTKDTWPAHTKNRPTEYRSRRLGCVMSGGVEAGRHPPSTVKLAPHRLHLAAAADTLAAQFGQYASNTAACSVALNGCTVSSVGAWAILALRALGNSASLLAIARQVQITVRINNGVSTLATGCVDDPESRSPLRYATRVKTKNKPIQAAVAKR